MIECHHFIILNETVQLGKYLQRLLMSQKQGQASIRHYLPPDGMYTTV